MQPINLKNEAEIEKMKEGGRRLASVKHALEKEIIVGKTAAEVEESAGKLILAAGAKPSFKMVKGYKWATCINMNDGLVHGIPDQRIVFRSGDVVSVDVGAYYEGFHTDTSFSVDIDGSPAIKKFLGTGREALAAAIDEVKPGNRIYDISAAIQKKIRGAGLTPVKALVGHGVGKSLHEEPAIPCFTAGKKENSPEIVPGMVLAIEVMYAQGSPEIVVDSDGWTIRMADGKMAALFEETVAVTLHGPLVLTN